MLPTTLILSALAASALATPHVARQQNWYGCDEDCNGVEGNVEGLGDGLICTPAMKGQFTSCISCLEKASGVPPANVTSIQAALSNWCASVTADTSGGGQDDSDTPATGSVTISAPGVVITAGPSGGGVNGGGQAASGGASGGGVSASGGAAGGAASASGSAASASGSAPAPAASSASASPSAAAGSSAARTAGVSAGALALVIAAAVLL
ncbi:hypothetical protein Q8F55_004490 [Vanrija albida]|uniref:Extracellular membrane protein CFEM domain-containing protein n=1 Tax=Vanrija albida TaxID=181172 RepID=A0ABR3Q7I6_9TREE